MAPRAPRKETAAARKASGSSRADSSPPTARAISARLKALQKASAALPPPVMPRPTPTPAELLASVRAAMTLGALAAHAGKIRAQAHAHGFKVSGVLVAIGVGWIIGANSFDAHAPSPQVIQAMTVLANRLDEVETIARRAEKEDMAGLRASVASLQANLETNRSQTNTAIIEFSARVDALDRDSATRMVYAARDASARFEKLDRDVNARLAEVDKFVARTSERVQKLEQRSDPEMAAQEQRSATPAARAASFAPLPLPRPAFEDQFSALETTRVPAEPRSRNVQRIPRNGYVLRDVRDGVALLEGRSGLRAVAPGDAVPGAGMVRAIERRGAEWVVVTSVGVIDSREY
jgi:hypothetical protein